MSSMLSIFILILLSSTSYVSYGFHARFLFYRMKSSSHSLQCSTTRCIDEPVKDHDIASANISSLDMFHKLIYSIPDPHTAFDIFTHSNHSNGQHLEKTFRSLEVMIDIICQQKQWSMVDKLFYHMRSQYNVTPNDIIYKDLIKFSAKNWNWIEARKFLNKQIKHHGNNDTCYPPPKSYIRVLRAMSKAKVWREVMTFYRTSFKGSFSFNAMLPADKIVFLYEPMLCFAAKDARYQEAMAWMDEMKAMRMTPSRACYRHVVEACSKALKLDVAMRYLDELQHVHNVTEDSSAVT